MAEPSPAALRRYAGRVSDRWRLERAVVHQSAGGWTAVLVSTAFDGVPWLERVRQAEALWDAGEAGGDVEVHAYTPVELERKMRRLPAVRAAVEEGMDVLGP